MDRPPHVAVVVPDGVGYRNFVLGRLGSLLPGPVTVLHGLDPTLVRKAHLEGVDFQRLPPFREWPWGRLLREAKSRSQLFRHAHSDAGDLQLRRLRPRSRRLRPWLLHGAASVLAWILQRVPTVLDRALGRAMRRHPDTVAAERLLRRIEPDVVFCTHQRASAALPVMTAARSLGIPTATFVFSWDNLPKGRMPIDADLFLVWGPQMRREMERYFPNVDPSRVIETGTPQFEPYFDRDLVGSREDLCADLGLDPRRPIVLFSGDDVTTSPDDPLFLRDLAQALRHEWSDEDEEPPQLVFRRCPVDLSGRYEHVMERFPEIVDVPPRWQDGGGDWQGVLPSPEDLALLANLMRHADVVVNLGSTMGVDAAVFDTPAIFVRYQPEGGTAAGWRVADIYRLPHFRLVREIEPFHWGWSPEELGPLVRECLQHPERRRAARRRILEELCVHPLAEASERCARALVELAESGADGNR